MSLLIQRFNTFPFTHSYDLVRGYLRLYGRTRIKETQSWFSDRLSRLMKAKCGLLPLHSIQVRSPHLEPESPTWQPALILSRAPKSHHYKTGHIYCSQLLRNPKGFRGSIPGKDQIYISYYKSQYQPQLWRRWEKSLPPMTCRSPLPTLLSQDSAPTGIIFFCIPSSLPKKMCFYPYHISLLSITGFSSHSYMKDLSCTAKCHNKNWYCCSWGFFDRKKTQYPTEVI